MNIASCEALNLAQHATANNHFLDYVRKTDRDAVEKELKTALAGTVARIQTKLMGPHAGEVEVDLFITPLTGDTGIIGLFVSADDLTQQHSAQTRLEESQAQYQTFYQSHPEPIFMVDRHGKFTHMNSAAQNFLGHSGTSIIQKSMFDYVIPELQDETREKFRHVLRGAPLNHETTFQLSDGRVVQLSIIAVPSGDPADPDGLHCIARDVTDERLAHENLSMMVRTDSHTGLFNRYAFDHDLRLLIEKNTHFTLLIVDVDRLKNINDTWGRSVGDCLLELATTRMLTFAPEKVTIYRYTGDQFFILFLTENLITAQEFAAQLVELFDEPFQISEHNVRTTVSIGGAHYPANATNAESLVTNAEHAVISAKEQGRNRFLWWSDIATPAYRENAEIAVLLSQAILNDELSLAYQPQIEFSTGKIFGVEALLRWNNPQFGQVATDRFINLAERSGLIVEMGSWALNRACDDFVHWKQLGLDVPHVSVNISMLQFQDRGFIQVVSDAIERSGIEPEQLVLEITESIPQTQDSVLERMLEIQQLGVQLALDDFGTGFSSFSAVHDFPLAFMKVDRIFVTYLEEDRSSSLTSTVLNLAKNLQLVSIVEGIETSEQFKYFQALGADIGQGYYFSKPIGSEPLIKWLQSRALPTEQPLNNSATFLPVKR